jgi:RNA polymerase sigma-70 factor (ECF subfamily)
MVNYRADLAEELTQETFYQTYLSLHKYRGECAIKTWICSIAKNTCFTYFKKNPICDSMEEEERNGIDHKKVEISMEDRMIHKEDYQYLMQLIRNLDQKYQDVLTYRIFYEMSFADIAKTMKISENSAKVLYHRGKEMVKKRVNSKYL